MRNLPKTPSGEFFDTRTGNTIKPPARGSRYYTDAVTKIAYNPTDGEYFVLDLSTGAGQWATPEPASSQAREDTPKPPSRHSCGHRSQRPRIQLRNAGREAVELHGW